jgi:hypothetical protein
MTNVKKYDTYEEAQEAVKQLAPVPTCQKDYFTVYKQDPRLMVSPYRKYKDAGWSSWEAFLGKEKKASTRPMRKR